MSHHFHIPQHVLALVLVGIMLTALGVVYRLKLSKVENIIIPDKGITTRNIVEALGQFIYNQCQAIMGENNAKKYFPLMITFFILIFASNLLGLIPGLIPPTDHLSTTLALGVISFLYYNYIGCKEQGVINYIKHFAGPVWYAAVLIFPLEIVSNIFRPFTLALRLRGNMMGDHLVLQVFSEIIPNKLPPIANQIMAVLAPMPFFLLGMLVCFIQAFVFTMLSIVYIGLVANAHHDHDEHHQAAHH
ncbi:MAG: ATP synthase F0 subunit A [Bdellovibrionales bacterium RIFOXYD12_FULL_39_22]|nr:MAG: ATP synthase F0 subunit A [Bdellovibrionales bacterium RIFOXYB1_FULL_39_21]OFZ45314.1 MAG: ATP synthase F0 subunit A [Bdellovibrionales bacterium RIFOXYC12_FULL_39_17]OFZ45695.1 MAG: ATP synthase F0 subunit A [Bdellovibrionales bacterium RIFOXYC1_FULL_39_130]OFZ77556.1 MAG: ATP synthase F0 subunit A [Bdellovibrionales bacterium RIFOXYD1_FULL_39_84]OFZ91685.1 MAG: ATP synthase F0 subunit A [Bdellovibrionales bacterium RIFOXYD12_FULL_39_22]